MSTRAEVYRDKHGDWRWRIIEHHSGKIVADSAEGYARKIDALHGLDLATREPTTTVIDEQPVPRLPDPGKQS